MTFRKFFHPFPKGNPLGLALLVVTGVMVIFGSMMIASASEGQAAVGGSTFHLMINDALYLVIGLIIMWFMMVVEIRKLLSLSIPIMAISLALLAYVMLAGVTVSGAKRWMNVGGQLLQPSEFFKFALILFVAYVVTRHHSRLASGQHLVVFMLPVLAGLVLIVRENDLGTTSIVGAIALAMLVAVGMSRFQIAVTIGAAISGALIYGQLKPYALARFMAFIHPNANLASSGYQLFESKIALGSGYLWGLGYGQSRTKWGFLPNPHTDFIFSIIGEELGLLGTVMVIVLFAIFLVVASRIIGNCRNETNRLIAVGITTWIILEALINIASVVGFWAVTGVPLPFFSYGGSATVTALAAVGLLYNIAHDKSTTPRIVLRADDAPFIALATSRTVRHRPVSSRPHSPVRSRPS
jgi:cell division protein FtsW